MPPRKTLSPRIGGSRASGIRTPIPPIQSKRRRNSKRSPRLTKYWATPKSVRSTTSSVRIGNALRSKPNSNAAIAISRHKKTSTLPASHFDGAGGPSGFSDFFDAFFSGVGAGARRTTRQPFQQRGQDLETTLDLSLRESYEGGKKSVSLQIEDLCPQCRGTGTVGKSICPKCHGTGRVLETKRFDVTIPKGVREGQRIRLAGQGGTGIGGGPKGDLYLVVHFKDDQTYTRKEDDLYIDMPVSIYELVLGGEVRVPTMSGDVTMTVPPGTQSNKLLRLTGKGMPHSKGSGSGDQYVRLIGTVPQNLSEKELKLYRELATLHNGKP